MKTRIITAICMMIVILPCVFIGAIPFQILSVLLACGGVFEMLSICDRPKSPIYLYPIVGLFVLYSLFFNNSSTEVILIYMIVLLSCSIFDNRLNLMRVSYYFLSGVLIGLGFSLLYQLRMSYGFDYILIIALATLGSDTGAYFTGMLFGKHKLNPRLSPKKTIEGSIGGIIFGTLLSVLYGLYIHINIPFAFYVMICIILTITGQIGDLTFSSIKRTFEVKDYSQIFPGHGGVLDRFDSLLFNSMVFGVLLHFVAMVV